MTHPSLVKLRNRIHRHTRLKFGIPAHYDKNDKLSIQLEPYTTELRNPAPCRRLVPPDMACEPYSCASGGASNLTKEIHHASI